MDKQKPLEYAQFIGWFPEFAGLPAGPVTFALDFDNSFLCPMTWGKLYQQAVALLTAHHLSLRFDISPVYSEQGLRSPFSTVNLVTNKSASTTGLSEGNATNALQTGDNPLLLDLSRTEYGLQFLFLLYTYIPACGVVFSPDASATYALRGFPW